MKLLKNVSLLFAALAVTGCATGELFNTSQEWVAHSRTGSYLILADKADALSEQRVYKTQMGQDLGVQSKFLFQKGTTCEYEVTFTNKSNAKLTERVTLGRDNTGGVYDHRLSYLDLAPGQSATYAMEQRECEHINWGETKEMQKCGSCKPVLILQSKSASGFYK